MRHPNDGDIFPTVAFGLAESVEDERGVLDHDHALNVEAEHSVLRFRHSRTPVSGLRHLQISLEFILHPDPNKSDGEVPYTPGMGGSESSVNKFPRAPAMTRSSHLATICAPPTGLPRLSATRAKNSVPKSRGPVPNDQGFYELGRRHDRVCSILSTNQHDAGQHGQSASSSARPDPLM
jgi:hypothetical protein